MNIFIMLCQIFPTEEEELIQFSTRLINFSVFLFLLIEYQHVQKNLYEKKIFSLLSYRTNIELSQEKNQSLLTINLYLFL